MENLEKIPLIVVVGPTASGKTALGINLAKIYDGEIISADSMQIYKGLDVTTAKPSKEEMDGVPHHLISFVEPLRKFSVAEYVKLAAEKIEEINSRGKIPILVGGTGLYVDSLIDNVNFDEAETDGSVRAELEKQAKEIGAEAMLEILREIDPASAEQIPANNIVRVIRAIEVYKITGTPFSEYKIRNKGKNSRYNVVYIGLNYENRDELYDKINYRVEVMPKLGMIEECLEVYNENKRQGTSFSAIGYKEFIPYFEKNAELSDCIELIKQSSRRYAKRQLTWFRRNEKINWIMLSKEKDISEIVYESKKIVQKSKIISDNSLTIL